MRVSLELFPADGDRLEGRILTGDGRADLMFSGTLDLLRALEELRRSDQDQAGSEVIDLAVSPLEGERQSC